MGRDHPHTYPQADNRPRPYHPPAPNPQPTAAIGDNGRIDRDAPCLTCGYNLRGLVLNADCPECGRPIHKSMLSDRLTFQDSDWLGRLRYGARWCVISHLAWPIGMLVKWAIMATYPFQGGTYHMASYRHAILISQLVTVAMVLTSIVGHWALTTPSPCPRDPSRQSSLRIVSRWGLVTAKVMFMTIYVLDLVQTYIVRFTGYFLSVSEGLIFTFGFIGLAAWLTGTLVLFSYERELAKRIPQPRLAKQFRWLSTSYMLGAVAWMVLIILARLGISHLSIFGIRGLDTIVCLGMAVPCVLWGWELGLLIWQSHVLSATARAANENPTPDLEASISETRHNEVAADPM